MTDSRVDQLATESAAQSGAPGRSVVQQGVESLARATGLARTVLQQGAESAAQPIPGSGVSHLLAESLVSPDQSMAVHASIIEVLWREPPTPGIFAFGHDWSAAWREQRQWRTNVIESHDGGESRIKLRNRPLRRIGLSVLAGEAMSVNLDAWLHAHQGRTIHLPIWLTMRRVSIDAAAGDTSLTIANLDLRFQRTLQTRSTGVTGSGPMLIMDADGDAQIVWVTACDLQAGTVDLREPLARPVQAMARCAPVIEARLIDEVRLVRHAASVSAVELEFDADPPLYVHAAPSLPTLNAGMGWTVNTNLPVLDPRNWATEHHIQYTARIDALDNGIAQAWVSRRNARPSRVLSWSMLAHGADQIEAALGLVEYLSGRWQECWVADDLTGIDLLEAAVSGQTTLIVNRGTHPTFLEEGWRGLMLYVPGQPPAPLRMSGMASDDDETATLQLATPLPHDAPAGSRLCGLRYARLDHDLVDLVWHTDEMLELSLRFAELPPRVARMSGAVKEG